MATDRLRSHAKVFDGLLQLIPAKYYYGEDTSDQWQRKKQTKEEARAAKLAKLDPDNAKSAKDVMEENARKRKREKDRELSEVDGIVIEKPKEGLREVKRKTKKQRREEKITGASSLSVTTGLVEEQRSNTAPAKRTDSSKRKEKRDRKKAKDEVKANKFQAKRGRKAQKTALVEDGPTDIAMAGQSDGDEGSKAGPERDLDRIDITNIEDLVPTRSSAPSTSTPSPAPQSPVFDASTTQSGTSSISSITQPTPTSSTHKPESDIPAQVPPNPKADPEELKARLQQRIEALRAARKANTLDGTPARNRQELMEARRRKEEQRKAHKKELRQRAREEEVRQRDLALTRASPLVSGSPATGSNAMPSPLRESTTEPATSFSFGRVAFSDGAHATPTLSSLLDPQKRKGPQDPLTALRATESRSSRLSTLDPAKRADIEEKDVWLNAKKRAHGERVRDDSSLLKKTLKRKEKAKKKSEREWGERTEGVVRSKENKQKRREENLAKRKEEKGVKKGKGGGKGKGKGKGNPKKVRARPGFEGSFRAK
ncbi:MAG: hypothetical protein Q9187_004844, partial [Circinaria calcarea]